MGLCYTCRWATPTEPGCSTSWTTWRPVAPQVLFWPTAPCRPTNRVRGEVSKNLIEAGLVDCIVALPGQNRNLADMNRHLAPVQQVVDEFNDYAMMIFEQHHHLVAESHALGWQVTHGPNIDPDTSTPSATTTARSHLSVRERSVAAQGVAAMIGVWENAYNSKGPLCKQ